MKTESKTGAPTKASLWTGRALSGIVILFLLMDSTMKILKVAPAIQGTLELGYSVNVIIPLGILLLICLALYVIPSTSILGAILLTGYLGGAIATHVRVGNPWTTHILFPAYVALFLWGGLYLRDNRLRALIPLRHTNT